MVYVGAALWGLHMGLTQGLLAALVAAAAPADLRGTAFGVFNLVCGIALLVASALAGWLWDTFGPGVTFYAGAAFTLVAWIGLTRLRPRRGRSFGEPDDAAVRTSRREATNRDHLQEERCHGERHRHRAGHERRTSTTATRCRCASCTGSTSSR